MFIASLSTRPVSGSPLRAVLRFVSGLLFAALSLLAATRAHADDEFLPPDKAFKFAAQMVDPATIAVTFQIADGYYMYRERFHFEASGAKLGEPQIPSGVVKFDETFKKNVETYHRSLTVRIPVDASGPFTLVAGGQGCSEKGLCYPPQEYRISLSGQAVAGSSAAPAGMFAKPQAFPSDRPGAGPLSAQPASDQPAAPAAAPPSSVPGTAASAAARPASGSAAELGLIEAALRSGNMLVIVPMFVLIGIGLSFTPCVLPMVPILSSIIVGEGSHLRRSRSFILSLAYVLGMAIVYTALGVAAGLLGEGLTASLQNAWMLGAFGLLMAGLSLSMFGLYELQVPAAIQEKLTGVSNRQASGKLLGVFVMGAISALIVGPCVAGALVGVLLFIGKTGNAVVGGGALFSMAMGMGVPLLALGLSAGWLLPRAGIWMDQVKRFFGALMLATALWLVSPVLPGFAQMLGWTALGIGYGMYLLNGRGLWFAKSLGLVFAVLGVLQLVGLASGGRDPLAPLAHLGGGGQPSVEAPQFTRIKTVEQLDAALAQTGGKTALLDFYADWCVSCKEMEKFTFVDPQVSAKLANSVLLQVDVTANDAADKAMLKRFGLFGPPGIIMFDGKGQELPETRVIGYQNAQTFLASLGRLP